VKPKNRLIVNVLVALWSAIAHPLARAMDSCTAMIAALCSIEPPPPTDQLEPHPELAIAERARGEQPPPPITLGGQTATFTQGGLSPVVSYMIEDAFPHLRANTSAIFHLLRNGAVARVSAPSLVQPPSADS
jgi:hypothetical protein